MKILLQYKGEHGMRLSERAKKNPVSGIRFMFELAQKYDDVINLCIGEPDFPTPPHLVEAGVKALKEGHTKYTSNAGVLELRKAISEKLKKDNNILCNEENIVVTAGATEAISLVMLTLINSGDEVILPTPCWPNYNGQILMAGGTIVPVSTYEEDGFHVKAKAIEDAVTDKTKLVIINSPSNPTGAVLSKEELMEIGEVIKRHDLMVLSDEPYEKLIYDNKEHISLASLTDMQEHVITVNSFSKTFSMTGWRVGYAVASQEIASHMTTYHENLSSCTNAPAQQVCIEALRSGQGDVDKMVKAYKKRRDLLVNGLNGIKGISCIVPEGAFYAFVNVKKLGGTSQEVANDILENAQVVTTPGSAFGEAGEGYLRISYASGEELLKEAIDRIKKHVESKS